MKREERFPIEPLPDAAWQRIERSVLERAHVRPAEAALPSRRVVRGVAIAVALQVAAAALFLLWPRSGVAPALTSARIVTAGDTTETMLGDTSIRVEPNSALLLIEGDHASSLVVLERGVAHFSVPARGKRAPFAVQAGEVRVEVVGTRFRVEHGSGLVRVDTYEGKVRVVSHGESTFVARDESWSDPPARAHQAAAPPVDAPASPAPPIGKQPHDAAKPPIHTGSARSDRSDRSDRRALLFDQAARREASEPAQALRLYGALVSEGGRWAEPALYAMARLSLELGDRSSAERLLQQYLARHPRGANASDVRSLVEQLSSAQQAAP